MQHQSAKPRMIGIDVLHVQGGDKPVLTVDDSDPLKREELAKEVLRLIRKGYLITIGGTKKCAGRKVVGYDAQSNEWLVAPSGVKGSPERVSATKNRRATAIAPQAGG